MSFDKAMDLTHPEGEMEKTESAGASEDCTVETYAGKLRIRWDDSAAVTAMGQMPVFIDFLKTSGLWDGFVADCPLRYTSPNAPSQVDILGTLLMSVLAGQWRYAHITGLRGDGVNPNLLGMRKVMSEDSARRAFKQAKPEETRQWLKRHLRQTYEPLLEHAWVMDLDSTVKPLYGKQEKAVKGYNPAKPGRPSHVIHTYLIAQLRLVLGAEVQAGNETASSHAQPGFWNYFDTLPRASRPVFLRGDIGWGTERMMQEAEQRDQAYLFKIRQSVKIKELLAGSFAMDQWQSAGQGWEGTWSEVRLAGWTSKRRVILLRRHLREDFMVAKRKGKGRRPAQMELEMGWVREGTVLYEYAVLVTNMKDDIFTLAQHYRDRGDAENSFDELKNQWGWLGFTTHDHARSEMMTLFVALVYNWWSLFTRLSAPHQRVEAITSRPLLLHAIGRKTSHSNQSTLTLTSLHAEAGKIQVAMKAVAGFLGRIRSIAEQLKPIERWRLILRAIVRAFPLTRAMKMPPVAYQTL
jgi:Transposase DDE domain group 1